MIMLEKFLITDTAKFRSMINIGNVFKKIKIYNADQTKSRLGVICKKGLLKLDLKEEYYMDFQTLQPILKSKR